MGIAVCPPGFIETENSLPCAGSTELLFYCVELYGDVPHALCHAPFLQACRKVKAVFQDKRGFKRSYWS